MKRRFSRWWLSGIQVGRVDEYREHVLVGGEIVSLSDAVKMAFWRSVEVEFFPEDQ